MLMSYKTVKIAALVIKPVMVSSGFKQLSGRNFAYARFSVNHPLAKEFEVGFEVERGDDWVSLLISPLHVEDLKRRMMTSLRDIVPKIIGVSDTHVLIDDIDNWDETVVEGFASHVFPKEEKYESPGYENPNASGGEPPAKQAKAKQTKPKA